MKHRGLGIFFACMLIATMTTFAFAFIWSQRAAPTQEMKFSGVRARPPQIIELEAAREKEGERIRKGGENYKPLQVLVDFPGIRQPDLLPAAQVTVSDSTPIVGIEVNGKYCAFVLESMLDPSRHIVNLVFNDESLSVTYCNFVDCVRILTDETKVPIPLRVGGLDIDNQLVLLLNEQRYGQSSDGIPLADHPFSRMSLGEWKRLHPSTKVYQGLMDPGS